VAIESEFLASAVEGEAAAVAESETLLMEGRKEAARNISKAKNVKTLNFGEIAREKAKQALATAEKAQNIPGITVETTGKILFDETVATARYAKELGRLGLKPSITKDLLSHVRHRHYADGSKFLFNLYNKEIRKSVFNYHENFIKLALEAIEKGVKVKPDVIVYDFGRVIGLNNLGDPTTKIRVVLNGTLDAIRTIFPV